MGIPSFDLLEERPHQVKFKSLPYADYKGFKITDKDGDIIDVQQRADGKKGLFIATNDGTGVMVSRDQALKLAWAIIDELAPDTY